MTFLVPNLILEKNSDSEKNEELLVFLLGQLSSFSNVKHSLGGSVCQFAKYTGLNVIWIISKKTPAFWEEKAGVTVLSNNKGGVML